MCRKVMKENFQAFDYFLVIDNSNRKNPENTVMKKAAPFLDLKESKHSPFKPSKYEI